MIKAVDKDIRSQKEMLFKKTQELFKMREEQAHLIGHISGCLSASRNLQANINNLKQQSQRQEELLYNAEFQIQQMERKVAKAQGDRSQEEVELLESEIERLKEIQADLNDSFSTLNKSNKQLVDELRNVERLITKHEGDMNILSVQI